jgi:hypothetical protein
MNEISIGVFILLGLLIIIFICTRNNVANIVLILPIWALLIYIILNSPDTWIQISCETGIIAIFLIGLARSLRRA